MTSLRSSQSTSLAAAVTVTVALTGMAPHATAQPAQPPGALPTTPVLPTPKRERQGRNFLELDGYFRLRADWFKQFNMGFTDDPDLGGAPFPVPLGCKTTPLLVPEACKGTLRSTNIRLRLEPTIHLDEHFSAHFQVDVYDNFVLGSTPDGFFGDGTASPGHAQIGAFSNGQAASQAGRNYDRDAIAVKRAWGEAMTPVGMLKFGRMPAHWGMGLVENAGGFDPFTGEYDLDSNFGDTVDRIAFGTVLPDSAMRVTVALDWPSVLPTSAQTDADANRYDGQAFDLDDRDNVYQLVATVADIDSPADFRARRQRGNAALNWGVYLAYRYQDFAVDATDTDTGVEPGVTIGEGVNAVADYALRDARMYIPDVWLKYGHGDMTLETEITGTFGNIERLVDADNDLEPGENEAPDEYTIKQIGAVARFGYEFLDGELHLGFETGYASGDQWDNEPAGSIHVSNARRLPGPNDTSFNAFRFDFDYEVDLILFRELIGTVTNAVYFKPTFRYDLTETLTMRAQSVWSLAPKPVATPGNSAWYGIELDGDLGYENDGFFAGLSYGVLFPLGALDHRQDGPFGFNDNFGEALTPQTFQARAVLKF